MSQIAVWYADLTDCRVIHVPPTGGYRAKSIVKSYMFKMLAGIATSNSTLIVEFARHLLCDGMNVQEAVATACRIRPGQL